MTIFTKKSFAKFKFKIKNFCVKFDTFPKRKNGIFIFPLKEALRGKSAQCSQILKELECIKKIKIYDIFRFLQIRYEDLCSNPQLVIGKISSFLGYKNIPEKVHK